MNFLLAVLLPAVTAFICFHRSKLDFSRNIGLVLLACLGSVFMALPPLQASLHIFGQPMNEVVVVPLFVALYPIFGKFDLPSPATAFCGTFISLMFADLSAAMYSTLNSEHIPWWQPYTWIGGNGIFDGLLWLPLGSAALAFFIRRALVAGYEIRFLHGRDNSRGSS